MQLLDDHLNQEWDAVVIGTGMGGGTAGYALAKAGRRVLFIDKGLSHRLEGADPIAGFPENQIPSILDHHNPQHRDILRRSGRNIDLIVDMSSGKPAPFMPIIGSGLGGSSTLYGAILERFFPPDFKATAFFSDAKGTSVVDWPIGYEDLAAYYDQAELIYKVYGGSDPLRKNLDGRTLPSIPLSAIGQELFDHFQKIGLHPYQVHVGHAPHQNCPGCQATICIPGEKSGSGECCVLPAVKEYGAAFLDRAEAIEIVMQDQKAIGLKVNRDGKTYTIKAAVFVLGAGALETPRLLLRSKSTQWPNGVGNNFDQVGRHLMRHYMDLHMILVKASTNNPIPVAKEIAINDFYFYGKEKLGTVQSLGNLPSIAASLSEMHAQHFAEHPRMASLYFPLMAQLVRVGMKYFLTKGIAFATIMEDLPYAANRLWIKNDASAQIEFSYHLSEYEKQRIKKFRRLVGGCFKPYLGQIYGQAENNQRMAHACGTCRMGVDPASSVVDPWQKVHGVENIYVVDAAVFPTSSGMNPALTIAALALRTVAGILREK